MAASPRELQPLQAEQDINEKWLQTMLSLKLGRPARVHSWTSRTPRGREGFLSEIAFVSVSYSKDGEEGTVDASLVFKFLPQDPALRQFLANGGLTKREVEFYNFVSSSDFQEICQNCGIDLPVPETYYAGYTEEAITIVLHDMNTDKFKSVIVKEGSSLEQTRTALKSVALVHAAGLLYIKQHGKGDSLKTLSSPFKTDFYDQFFLPNLDTLSTMYKGSPLSSTMQSLKPLTQVMYKVVEKRPFIDTVIHGDLWAGQLMYSEEESRAVIIDWQFSRTCNPVTDIVSMFFMSSNPSVLPRYEELLRDYWAVFTGTVKAGGASVDLTFENLLSSVEDCWILGFQFLAVSIHDFIGGGNITDERIFGAIDFLEKRGVFKKFIEEFSQ
ncbi:uncharacterized protein LOC122266388 [Penaeus japonicus]|uniref:uncharacterized protein LOC122266388 n=1 Tax=Penaeus japonicus TaxID=27405 RepID=UPI001C715D57|nr:uncharacterized protein LOC122266388 [Penaeus japonicus]